MTTPRQLPQRKSPRLQGYDYAQAGAYFVTLCTHLRESWFGEVIEDEMVLSDAGKIAAERWLALPDHHAGVELDAFVVMPNHVHGIIVFVGTPPVASEHTTDAPGRVPTTTLGNVIALYKGGVTRRVRSLMGDAFLHLWQGRYHDHIIRNDADLHRIREYVLHNPSRWAEDVLYQG